MPDGELATLPYLIARTTELQQALEDSGEVANQSLALIPAAWLPLYPLRDKLLKGLLCTPTDILIAFFLEKTVCGYNTSLITGCAVSGMRVCSPRS